MTTISEKLISMMFERGLFENQAKAVLERYLQDPISEGMRERMNDSTDDYPSGFVNVLWPNVAAIVVEWIDANCPRHWARPMFAE